MSLVESSGVIGVLRAVEIKPRKERMAMRMLSDEFILNDDWN